MSFANQMTTADEIVELLQRHPIQDPSDDYKKKGGTKVSFSRPGFQHQQLNRGTKEQGGGVTDASVRHMRIRTRNKITHVELAETQDSQRRDEAITAATAAFLNPDGTFRPGASMEDFTRTTDEIRRQFATTSSYGTKVLLAKFHPAAVPGMTIPCYHLPWNPAGCAMRLRIPNVGGGPASDNNPIFFLTSALSGCSIYVMGTPKEPIIYHCGTEGMTGGDNSKQFWDAVMRKIGHNVQAAGVGAIHATDYMLPKRGAAGIGEQRREATESALKKGQGRDMKIESTSSWGSLFGVRDAAGNWTFYMQQNVSVIYYEYKQSGLFGLGRKRIDIQRTVSRPILLQEIFPAHGSGAARLIEPQLRLLDG